METFDADKINKELYDRLSKETQELIDKAEKISESDVKEGINIIDHDLGIRILEADEEKFDALVRLQEVLKFKNVPANELYELPGMKLGDKTITLYVPKTNIQKVADMGEYFEKELSYLSIKFPTQLYQFKKENYKKNLPGKDYPPPEPKTKEMTTEEYEKHLETYYEAHGVKKEMDITSFRRPYPHEKINYQEGNTEKEGFTNEYYTAELNKHAKGKGTTTPAPVGEKIKVSHKSEKRPFFFDTKDKVETSLKWSKVESMIIKTAAIAAGVGLTAALVLQAPQLLALGAAGIGVAVGTYIRKRIRRKRAEQEEIEKARRKKEREEREGKGKDKGKGLGEPTSTPETVPETVPETTPGSAPDTTPRSTPDTTPGSTPDTTPGSTPDTTPGSTPDTTPRSTPDTTPGSTPETTPNPAGNGYDYDAILVAEQELGMDQAEIIRIDKELAVIVAEVQVLLRSTNPDDADRLRELQEQVAAKYAQRLALIYNIMARQERMLDDIGIHLGR